MVSRRETLYIFRSRGRSRGGEGRAHNGTVNEREGINHARVKSHGGLLENCDLFSSLFPLFFFHSPFTFHLPSHFLQKSQTIRSTRWVKAKSVMNYYTILSSFVMRSSVKKKWLFQRLSVYKIYDVSNLPSINHKLRVISDLFYFFLYYIFILQKSLGSLKYKFINLHIYFHREKNKKHEMCMSTLWHAHFTLALWRRKKKYTVCEKAVHK